MLHIFAVTPDSLKLLSSLSDHSGAVTAIRFTTQQQEQLVSGSADKSLIFRSITRNDDGSLAVHRSGSEVLSGAIQSLAVGNDVDGYERHRDSVCKAVVRLG